MKPTKTLLFVRHLTDGFYCSGRISIDLVHSGPKIPFPLMGEIHPAIDLAGKGGIHYVSKLNAGYASFLQLIGAVL